MTFRLVRLDDESVAVAHDDGHLFTFAYSTTNDGARELASGDVQARSSSDDDGAFWYGAAYRFAAVKAARAGKIGMQISL